MKTYEFKLYRNDKKFKYLDNLLYLACDIWNFALKYKQNLYNNDKNSISKYDLQKFLTKEKINHKEWGILGSQVVQEITDRIYKGYNLFFLNLKQRKSKKSSRIINPPKIKKDFKYKSITFKQAGYKLINNNTIRIGEKTFKFHDDGREILGKIKTLTVKKNRLGEYFIYITTDYVEPQKSISQSGNRIGFDFGLNVFLTANTTKDDDILSPLFFKQDIKKIKKLHRSLSRKIKGSNNRKRARLKLARAYDKISNNRKNYHWWLANYLVHKYDVIFLETLDIQGMSKKHGKKINDLGFSDFINILQYQADKYNKKIIFIDKWYPSSKTCSNCLDYNKDLDKYTKNWTCEKCHAEHDRDRNAANNIYRVGTSTLAIDYIRPSVRRALIRDCRTPRL